MINEIPTKDEFWTNVDPESDSLHIVFAYGKVAAPVPQPNQSTKWSSTTLRR